MAGKASNGTWRTGEYHRNRAAVLADHPACAVRAPGCTGAATTVDHIVPRGAGGDHALANLRPSCESCNSTLGGRFGRAKQHARKGFLDADVDQHPPIRVLISPSTRADAVTDDEMRRRIPKRGRRQPRLATPAVGDSSHGPAVARWMQSHMRMRPMPWNRIAWNRVLATSKGRLAHRQALVSTSRQNSKTTWSEALAGWWLTEHADRVGAQTVLWLSHDLRLSERSFVRLARILEARRTYVTFSFGRQRMLLDNGSELAVASNTASAGHGFSTDLAIADEAWRLKPDAIDEGVIPSMRARANPLLVMTSTAGDNDSVLLRSWRDRGLDAVESGVAGPLCFLEWSMPPGIDPYNPRLWSWPNPCLGTTLTADTLIAESHGPRSTFLRASLNQWVAAGDCWLPAGQWDRCRYPRDMPDPVGGVVAAEVSQGGERFVAVHAFTHNGVTFVAPLVATESEAELWGVLETAYADAERVLVTPSLEPHLPATMARRTGIVGMRELARQVPLVRSMIAAGQIAHPGSAMLDEHVGRAVATASAGLSTAHSSGGIELARCLVWAAAAASRPQTSRRPAVAVARTAP